MAINMISFNDLLNMVQNRIAKIDPISGVFSIKFADNAGLHGTIVVACDDKVFVRINYFVNTRPAGVGIGPMCSGITIRVHNDSSWLHDKLETPFVNVGNNGLCWYHKTNENIDVEHILNDILPVVDQVKLERIEEKFSRLQVDTKCCKFDTFNKRYVVDMDLREFLDSCKNSKDTKPRYFYKYVSLDTLLSMLQNKTFRMNSVVSMNDTSETFALGDFLHDELDKSNRNRSMIANKLRMTAFRLGIYNDAKRLVKKILRRN